MIAALIAGLLFCKALFAAEMSEVVQSLLVEQWRPLDASVLWTMTKQGDQMLSDELNWTLIAPTSERPCGAMIVKLAGSDSSGQLRTVTFSGQAAVSVKCWTTVRTIQVGATLDKELIQPAEIEWKSAFGKPLQSIDDYIGRVVAQTLVPGRPICEDDLQAAHSIERGENIRLCLEYRGVHVKLAATAVESGVVGDEIGALTLNSPRRVYRGIIQEDHEILIKLPQ